MRNDLPRKNTTTSFNTNNFTQFHLITLFKNNSYLAHFVAKRAEFNQTSLNNNFTI